MMLQLLVLATGLLVGANPEEPVKDLDKFLDELHTFGVKNKMLNVPPDHGRFLWTMAQTSKAQRVLEIGTSDGYSTIWIARGVQPNGGKIITLEISKERHDMAVANFKKAGFAKIIDARLGDALKEIPHLDGEFDFIFIDAWKPDYFKYLQLVLPKVKPGGLILAHNAVLSAKEMSDFLEAIQKDPNLVTTIVQIGEDGFSVSLKKLKQ